MVNRPSVPEIITVNSDTLQTQIRDLLPSQNGFGSELQATNVITPVIDLTSAAEGSTLPTNLQTALAFGSQTAFNITNTTTVIASNPGFYRLFGMSYNTNRGVVGSNCSFTMTDGVTTKTIWSNTMVSASTDASNAIQFDFIVWLAAGESISGDSSSTASNLIGSVRQIANSQGELVNPSGYPL
jgi:hypothetical protein